MTALRTRQQVREAVKGYLIEGYGVEDIAVFTGLEPDAIRFHVSAMRVSGELEKIYKNGGGK